MRKTPDRLSRRSGLLQLPTADIRDIPVFKMRSLPLFCAIAVASLIFSVESCTTLVVGKKATKDGSVIATHSNDGGGTTDPRLVRVPARDFDAGSTRPIWASPENYPRYVGKERQVTAYFPENCQAGPTSCSEFQPIGYIPQVNHTYAYWEGTYGVMNEKQVGIGESTCSGVFVASAVNQGGKALLSIDQLSQIAMERASTSREAVEIMGDLAVKYGFYGESNSFEGGSESLLVIDPNEGWVFHILADPEGVSAIWVAARVPDDSVAVVANMFSVREVDLSDTANFLGRSDMWEIAQAQGLWAPGQPKDFTATFSDGEYAHKYYSGRRMWGVFNMLAPSANLPAEYINLKTSKPYPFAVPVDKPVSAQDVMAVMRSWYNGTVYSTSEGLAGGPFGTPDRFGGGAAESLVSGSWERTIALYRSSDSFLVQARSWLPDSVGGVVWWGPAAAHATNYVPLLAGMDVSPDCLQFGWQGVYNLSTAFWIHRLTLNIAQIKFDYMIEDIRALQNELETASQALTSKMTSTTSVKSVQAEFLANAQYSVVRFTELLHSLLFTYADNDINYWSNGRFHSSSTGYPAWWLEAVGYPNGPPPVELQEGVSKLAREVAMRVLEHQKTETATLPLKSAATAKHQAESLAILSTASEQQLMMKQRQCLLQCPRKFEDKFGLCVDSCLLLRNLPNGDAVV